MALDRWLAVELRHLAALGAVARARSFGRAASLLGYTQPAISQQIAALERIVGERLVERPGGSRAVSLTEPGEMVLRHAEGIMARVQAAQADLAAYADGAVGFVRVGTIASVGARILPSLVRSFTTSWPDVRVDLHVGTRDVDLLEMIEWGSIDLAFAMLPFGDGPLDGEVLFEDPYVLLVQAGSPLARAERPPAVDELAGLSLIGYRRCRAGRIEVELRARGVEPRVVLRSDDSSVIQALVAAGVGAAIVPRLVVDPTDARVVALPLPANVPGRRIGVVWHRDRTRSPAVTAFVSLARSAAGRQALEAAGGGRPDERVALEVS